MKMKSLQSLGPRLWCKAQHIIPFEKPISFSLTKTVSIKFYFIIGIADGAWRQKIVIGVLHLLALVLFVSNVRLSRMSEFQLLVNQDN